MAAPPNPHHADFAPLEVDRFEHVPSGRELALLRIEGRYRSRLARPLLEAALLIDDGLAIHRHDPLPASFDLRPGIEDDDWLWRSAFAISVAALEDEETSFSVQVAPNLVLEIGRPATWEAERRRRRSRQPAVVGRRAAAASILLALSITPLNISSLADAAGLRLKKADGTMEAIVDQAPPLDHPPYADLCAQSGGSDCGEVARAASQPAEAATPPAPEVVPAATQEQGQQPAGSKGDSSPSGSVSHAAPSVGHGHSQNASSGAEAKPSKRKGGKHSSGRSGGRRAGGSAHNNTGRVNTPRPALHHTDGSPTRSNPGFFDALPGPGAAKGVPNFVIRKFRVPVFLLPIYQAAGTQYGIRWEVLAAINEIETDYGRNLNVSSAGALGWMQFMPATWRMYGVDANKDGTKDPFNPVDAIFAAARYLNASGGDKNVRKAIFSYNHAGWYVDSVMLRAKLLAGVPTDVVGSLTGLTEGRFPVGARARYADGINTQNATRALKPGRHTNNVVNDNPARNGLAIFSDRGAPALAVNDGRIERIGHNRRYGSYVVLRDVYGNQYTYAGLGSVAKVYAVPKKNPGPSGNEAKAVAANSSNNTAGGEGGPKLVTKPRIFAHPARGRSKAAGGLEQMFDAEASNGGNFQTYGHVFTAGLGLNSKNATLRRLQAGSRVIGGTVLGTVGRPDPKQAAHMNFMIRPAGKGAPRIDPKPILDGWKLLESTAIYRAKGQNVLKDSSNASVGQILMMSKPLLERRVLNDGRIVLDASGRNDIRTGQIDRRVLAVLAYLAESGLRPTVSSLKSDHGTYTSSGNVSEHSTGSAVDIAAVNGIPITGHQDRGGIAEQTVRRLMGLQGTMRPHQIISLLSLGQNTLAMGDHYNHIHVGFRANAGDNRKTGRAASAVLDPQQWTHLIERLGQIENPIVPTSPSRYALPAKPTHRGHGD
jgi:murein DD-endopeptidase MepM/ murein hydrolase activator NlpD